MKNAGETCPRGLTWLALILVVGVATLGPTTVSATGEGLDYTEAEFAQLLVEVEFSQVHDGLGDDRYAFARKYLPASEGRRTSTGVSEARLKLCQSEASSCVGERNRQLWDPFMDDRSGAFAFRVGEGLSKPSGEWRFTTLVMEGWEFNPVALALWQRSGERWRLAGIGRTLILASLSGVEILEARRVSGGAWLLVGRTAGGDGSDQWSSLWVARWRLPDDFQLLYQVPEHLDQDGRQGGWKLDPSLGFNVSAVPGTCSGQTTEARVQLAPILEGLDQGKTALEMHRELGIFDNHRDLKAVLECKDLDLRTRQFAKSLLETSETGR